LAVILIKSYPKGVKVNTEYKQNKGSYLRGKKQALKRGQVSLLVLRIPPIKDDTQEKLGVWSQSLHLRPI